MRKLIIAAIGTFIVGAVAANVVEGYVPSPKNDAVIASMTEIERGHCMAHWDACQAVVAAKVRDAQDAIAKYQAMMVEDRREQRECDRRIALMSPLDKAAYTSEAKDLSDKYGWTGGNLCSGTIGLMDVLAEYSEKK